MSFDSLDIWKSNLGTKKQQAKMSSVFLGELTTSGCVGGGGGVRIQMCLVKNSEEKHENLNIIYIIFIHCKYRHVNVFLVYKLCSIFMYQSYT